MGGWGVSYPNFFGFFFLNIYKAPIIKTISGRCRRGHHIVGNFNSIDYTISQYYTNGYKSACLSPYACIYRFARLHVCVCLRGCARVNGCVCASVCVCLCVHMRARVVHECVCGLVCANQMCACGCAHT